MIDWGGVKGNVLVIIWLVVPFSDLEDSGRGSFVSFVLFGYS